MSSRVDRVRWRGVAIRVALVRIIAIICLSGCSRGPDRRATDSTPPATDSTPVVTNRTVSPATDVTGAFASMAGRLATLIKLPIESLPSKLAVHDSLVKSALAGVDREISDMGMKSSRAWKALVDSLEADLATLPTL